MITIQAFIIHYYNKFNSQSIFYILTLHILCLGLELKNDVSPLRCCIHLNRINKTQLE